MKVPRSCCASKSRTVALPVASPIADQSTPIVAAARPRLRSPTARLPLDASGLDQTSWPAPLSWTLIAWNAFGSWSTAMTSAFVRIARVLASIVRRSLPAMRGADIRAQSPKCVAYSVSDIPPFPTSSMSGSLKPPGAVAAAWRKLRSKIPIIVAQSSLMSSDMRHWWAVTGPHAAAHAGADRRVEAEPEAAGMDVVPEGLHAGGEGLGIVREVSCRIPVPCGPARVERHDIVSGRLETAVDHPVRNLLDQVLIDAAGEMVPAVPAHRRQGPDRRIPNRGRPRGPWNRPGGTAALAPS